MSINVTGADFRVLGIEQDCQGLVKRFKMLNYIFMPYNVSWLMTSKGAVFSPTVQIIFVFRITFSQNVELASGNNSLQRLQYIRTSQKDTLYFGLLNYPFLSESGGKEILITADIQPDLLSKKLGPQRKQKENCAMHLKKLL